MLIYVSQLEVMVVFSQSETSVTVVYLQPESLLARWLPNELAFDWDPSRFLLRLRDLVFAA